MYEASHVGLTHPGHLENICPILLNIPSLRGGWIAQFKNKMVREGTSADFCADSDVH